jgi:hypothetical protein
MLHTADATDIHADTFDLRQRRCEKASTMSYPKESPMKKIILATAAAVLLSTPLAFAANATTTLAPTPKPLKTAAASLSEQCTALGAQFDKAEATHRSHQNYKEALGLRSEGKSLCSAHKDSEGIKKIESALTMIGVKPMVKG